MGIMKDIAKIVKDRAKREVVDYLERLVEERKKRDAEGVANDEHVVPVDELSPEEQMKRAPGPVPDDDDDIDRDMSGVSDNDNDNQNDDIDATLEEISPLVTDDIERVKVYKITDSIPLSKKFISMLAELPSEEYALYIKLYILVHEKKKNFGYIGRSLRRLVGMDNMTSRQFDVLFRKLEKHGLLTIQNISKTQTGYTLYVPFDRRFMKKIAEKKEQKNGTKKIRGSRLNRGKSSGKRSEESESKRSGKGRSGDGGRKRGGKKKNDSGKKNNRTQKSKKSDADDVKHVGNDADNLSRARGDNESLYKSYRTFVNMEIDKAKMRVGRANFDKIYMEAVKFIDKKHGFSVLSNSDKFKEHLMEYYIAAFDIMGYDEWKRNKTGG